MSRSVKVYKEFISKVKAAVQRQGYARQKDLAEDLELSLATVSNFLNGRPVDYLNFIEICDKLGLDRRAIAAPPEDNIIETPTVEAFRETSGELPEELIYIERPPIESNCYQTLRQSGALLRIKAPGWMGKTSLMVNILSQLALSGYRTATLNLHYAEESDFSSLDKFLKWFCASVGKVLNIPNRLADYWDDEFSTSKINCTGYFEEYLLAQSASPLVLCLDEVERIFPYGGIASEFLGLIRAWHEQAKTNDVWKKLRLVVVHSTEVYVPLKVNESPFNVGVPIELPEFTPEQVNNLAHKYGLTLDLEQIKQLMEMVGGHPYLIGQAFSYLKINPSFKLDKILYFAATEAGIYSNHLRHYWNLLQKDSEVLDAFKKVVFATDKVRLETMQAYQLHRIGLVHLFANEVTIACSLYRQYFAERLQ